jgi:site-specific DNA-methyltransferase (cytosine-N4-specific)
VLQEYSESHKELLETGEYNDGKRGSGWDIDAESFANVNDGSIPDNLIEGFEAEDVLDRYDELSAMEFIELISDEDPEDLTAGDLLRILGMGGSTPDNLVEASNTASNTHYLRMCREFNFDHHPARFPKKIPEFFINFLTPNPPYDDWDQGALDRPIVLDIFAGSNLTGKVAETNGRYWLSFEQEEQYVQTSQFRFMDEDEIRDSLDDKSDFGEFAEVGDD